MNLPVWLCWVIDAMAALAVGKGLWSAFMITFHCPKRGDVIRYINRQNGN